MESIILSMSYDVSISRFQYMYR